MAETCTPPSYTDIIGRLIILSYILLVLVFVYVDPFNGLRQVLHSAVYMIKSGMEFLTDSLNPKLTDTVKIDFDKDMSAYPLVAPLQTAKGQTDLEQTACALQTDKMLRAVLETVVNAMHQQTAMLNAATGHITMLQNLNAGLEQAKTQQKAEITLAKQQICQLQDTVLELKLLIAENSTQNSARLQIVQDNVIQLQDRTEHLERVKRSQVLTTEVRGKVPAQTGTGQPSPSFQWQPLSEQTPIQAEHYVQGPASTGVPVMLTSSQSFQNMPPAVGLHVLEPCTLGAGGPVPPQNPRTETRCLSNTDLAKIARFIPTFDPKPGESKDTHIYLEDIGYHLAQCGVADTDTKVRLIYQTSNREVTGFVRRQTDEVRANWPMLCEAIIDEFADHRALGGLTSAMFTHQRKSEKVNQFYNRFRIAFFGNKNLPDMEEDVNFKDLFLNNLHPSIKKHLPIGINSNRVRAAELRSLAREAFDRELSEPQTAPCEIVNTQNDGWLPRRQDNCRARAWRGSRPSSHDHGPPPSLGNSGTKCKSPESSKQLPAEGPKESRRQRKARENAATRNSSPVHDNMNWRRPLRD